MRIIKKNQKIYLFILYLNYSSVVVGRENENKYYSADESLFTHDVKCQQIWLIGFTDNNTKDFHIVVTKIRDATTLETFIKRMIPVGNNIVTDGQPRYDQMDQEGSDTEDTDTYMGKMISDTEFNPQVIQNLYGVN